MNGKLDPEFVTAFCEACFRRRKQRFRRNDSIEEVHKWQESVKRRRLTSRYKRKRHEIYLLDCFFLCIFPPKIFSKFVELRHLGSANVKCWISPSMAI
uniref:Uncharacterized protein n=1 Tax=Octopus bimaculoides TaxID=37653 RepID=A0A0L8FIY9_OCTBM